MSADNKRGFGCVRKSRQLKTLRIDPTYLVMQSSCQNLEPVLEPVPEPKEPITKT